MSVSTQSMADVLCERCAVFIGKPGAWIDFWYMAVERMTAEESSSFNGWLKVNGLKKFNVRSSRLWQIYCPRDDGSRPRHPWERPEDEPDWSI